MRNHKTGVHGFTITEVLVVVAAAGFLLCVVLPALARTRTLAGMMTSMSNLHTLGVAHVVYAADHNGRQLTLVVDDFSHYGSNGPTAIVNYFDITGEPHPPMLFGIGPGVVYGSWNCGTSSLPCNPQNYRYNVPMDFQLRFGSFRVPNCKNLHDYVNGRFYEETYYPPNDTVAHKLVEPLFALPVGFVATPVTGGIRWASYVLSPAAMFAPQVMRSNAAGGWQNPYSLSNGFTSPALNQAAYPDLKTQMLEHHWNQGPPPNVCNPAFPNGTYAGCEPYYFNHALASAPVTLFYDGHVRLLSNAEVIAADAKILKQTSGIDGLWHRGTPLGSTGYYGEYSYDGTIVSHHILTTDGILGRDTMSSVSDADSISIADAGR